jgi:hypothetical protein
MTKLTGLRMFLAPNPDRRRAWKKHRQSGLRRLSPAPAQKMLCPVMWVSTRGLLLIMRTAVPLSETMHLEKYLQLAEEWDYMPGEDSCPL